MLQNLLPKNLPNLLDKSNFQKELNLIIEVTKDNIPTSSVESLTNKLLFLTAVISCGLISVTFLNYQFIGSKIETQNLESRVSSRFEDLSLKTRELPEVNRRFQQYTNAQQSKTKNLYVFEFLDEVSSYLKDEELVKVEISSEENIEIKTGKNFLTFIYNSRNTSIINSIVEAISSEANFKNLQTEKILIEDDLYQYVIKGELYER
jgi:hypothetical protein